MSIPAFSGYEWAVLVMAALLAGFAKTAVGGFGAVSVALLATVMPAKASTAVMLLLFIAGDLVAVRAYTRHVDWRALLRLSPYVVVGILAGVGFMSQVGDAVMRRTIGAVLLVLLALHVWQRRIGGRLFAVDGVSSLRGGAVSLFFGVAAGFTSMVANAGGAVMTVYLLSAGLGVWAFLGTSAWFFFAVNLFKTPFTAALGLFSGEAAGLAVVLVPAVLAGAVLGRRLVRHLKPAVFETLVVASTAVASLNLMT
jgi:hypothetical protein